MSRIKFNIDAMKFMSLFEAMTRAKLKDCIITDALITFIVEEGEIAKAIGKGAANIKKLEAKLKKKIKIVEFSHEITKFIQSLVYPAKVSDLDCDGKIVTITAADSKSRGLMIGREANILRAFEAIAKRYFEIEEIKVA